MTHAGAGTKGAWTQGVMHVLPKKLVAQWVMEGWGCLSVSGGGEARIDPATGRPGIRKTWVRIPAPLLCSSVT